MSHSTGTTRKQKDKKKIQHIILDKILANRQETGQQDKRKKTKLDFSYKKITTLVNITLRTTDLIKKYGERIFITATTYAAFIST